MLWRSSPLCRKMTVGNRVRRFLNLYFCNADPITWLTFILPYENFSSKSCVSVPRFVDDRTLEASPAHSVRSEETTFGRYRGENRHVRARQWRSTRCKPFSFDQFDAARRVHREMRLQEMRRMQDQWLFQTFVCSTRGRYISICETTVKQPFASAMTPTTLSKAIDINVMEKLKTLQLRPTGQTSVKEELWETGSVKSPPLDP
ncbi:hypothetical protein E1301_Tti001915 [Triplophysa tibetana]|uniref:Uncharacterized protein n=1 Tax=Triplophysa tibetana TaxID=1572043 RepID=A0A5A9PH57_9TELE|nr:hypothetical protein E1301_Tti001915 [Triplophysa tibetana]